MSLKRSKLINVSKVYHKLILNPQKKVTRVECYYSENDKLATVSNYPDGIDKSDIIESLNVKQEVIQKTRQVIKEEIIEEEIVPEPDTELDWDDTSDIVTGGEPSDEEPGEEVEPEQPKFKKEKSKKKSK